MGIPRAKPERSKHHHHLFAACDEGRCVSRGRTEAYGGSFTCYGDGVHYPRMCADGHLPVVVESEPPALAKPWSHNGFWETNCDDDPSDWIPVRYFTCCPPHRPLEAPVTRRCSDPRVISSASEEKTDHQGNSMLCEPYGNRTQAVPMNSAVKRVPSIYIDRTVSSSAMVESYLCCNDTVNGVENHTETASTGNTTTDDDEIDYTILTVDDPKDDYLEHAECVPYCNRYYDACEAKNPFRLSMFDPIVCQTPEPGFVVPRPTNQSSESTELSTFSGRYQCCRSGTALKPYVPDRAFSIEVGTFFAIYCLAAVASATIILALVAPLVVRLVEGTAHKNAATTTTTTTTTTTSLSASTHSRSHRTSNGHKPPRYSAYNLYLVYLAIPDFLLSVYALVKVGSMVRLTVPPVFFFNYAFMNAMAGFHTFSNLWINATVMHQVLGLLQSSQARRKIQPPSLARVSRQAFAIYCGGATTGVFAYFAYNVPAVSTDLGRLETLLVNQVYTGFFFFFTFVPIGYVVYSGWAIAKRGYLPPPTGSPSDAAVRELAVYLFRIVAVFVGVWFPSIVLRFFGNYYGASRWRPCPPSRRWPPRASFWPGRVGGSGAPPVVPRGRPRTEKLASGGREPPAGPADRRRTRASRSDRDTPALRFLGRRVWQSLQPTFHDSGCQPHIV